VQVEGIQVKKLSYLDEEEMKEVRRWEGKRKRRGRGR